VQDNHPRRGKNFTLKGRSRRSLTIGAILATLLVGIIAMVSLVVVVSASPETGAQGADWLRNLIGTKPVAELEAIVFTIQDKLHQFAYKVEQSTPSAPWEVSNIQASTPRNTNSRDPGAPTPTPSNSAQNSTSSLKPGESTAINASLPNITGTPVAESSGGSGTELVNLPQPVDTAPTQTPWIPANIPPLGNIADEGLWMPYIQDAAGNTVAYRTFLQPDSERPYVTVGIVAFDLTHTHLHYELGTLEPTSTINVLRTGQIPSSDRLPGSLLAAFNGGFKTVHGQYGVFMDGTVLVPPLDGMGTVVIYKDGSIRIGEWGADLTLTPDVAVYRQNCPLMVQNGAINPLVYNNSINDWGGTLSGNIVTFRSGIGISQDEKTLFYFAGNTLTMPSLAKAMQDAGAYQAMQLDINNYYVFFTSFEVQDGQLSGIPLLPKDMYDNINRYLDGFAHDFFYVTGDK
jgi:hypothetical protein